MIAALSCIMPANTTFAGLRIVYLRHAEGGHNVDLRDWGHKPRSEWPAYVGRADMLTPRGEKQVAAVPAKLAPFRFDFIAVSPTWRTQRIVASYLEQKGLTAELWPELEEFERPKHFDPALLGSSSLPAPDLGFLHAGDPISPTADMERHFRVRPDATRHFRLGPSVVQNTANLHAMQKAMIADLRTRFGKTGATILLVGHYHTGLELLRLLVGDCAELERGLDNGAFWVTEEQPDGSFLLTAFNDKPVLVAR